MGAIQQAQISTYLRRQLLVLVFYQFNLCITRDRILRRSLDYNHHALPDLLTNATVHVCILLENGYDSMQAILQVVPHACFRLESDVQQYLLQPLNRSLCFLLASPQKRQLLRQEGREILFRGDFHVRRKQRRQGVPHEGHAGILRVARHLFRYLAQCSGFGFYVYPSAFFDGSRHSIASVLFIEVYKYCNDTQHVQWWVMLPKWHLAAVLFCYCTAAQVNTKPT